MKTKVLPKIFNEKKSIVFITDVHNHLFTDFSLPDKEYTYDRFKEKIKAQELVLKKAQETNSILVMGGDLFHRRASVDTRVFNHVFKLFAKYPSVPCIFVRGNHDSVTNSLYTASSLDTFVSLRNIVVVSTPEVLSTDLLTFSCLPYGEEIEDMKNFLHEAVTTIDPNKANYLIAHIGVDGSSTGKYSHILSGAFSIGDLSPSKYDAVLLGHYHKRQFIGDTQNVLYGGNPLQDSFLDEGQDKGYHIIEGNTINFHAILQKKFITVDAEDIPEDSILANNYVQIKGTPSQVVAVKRLQETTGLTNIRVTVQKDYTKELRSNISAESTPVEVVREFTKEKYPDLAEISLACISEAVTLA